MSIASRLPDGVSRSEIESAHRLFDPRYNRLYYIDGWNKRTGDVVISDPLTDVKHVTVENALNDDRHVPVRVNTLCE